MSDKLFEGQHDDETVINVFRQFPIVMRKGLIFLLLFFVAGLLPYSFWFYISWMKWILIAGIVMGFVVLFYSWIKWYFTVHIVTDQRLIQIKQEGLFKQTVVDIGLDKIQNINYQIAGFQEAMLGFGTIIVQTYVGDLVIKYIHHPAKVHSELIKTIKESGFGYKDEKTENQVEISAKA